MIRSIAPRLRVLILAVALAPACAAAGTTAPALPSTPSPSPSRAIRELRAQLAEVFNAPIMSRGMWAVDVRSLDTGESLFELNAGKLTMPASNMKIVTMAAAAEILGWDYRFTTTLETSAPIVDGVLRGDVFIRGTGDPTISARENRAHAVLFDWVVALRREGITAIEGRIIGDDQAFDDEGLGGGWSWDYLQYGYAAPSGALQFNENVAQLTIAPGARAGEPAVVTLPPGSGLQLLNRTTTGDEGSAATIDYERHLTAPVLEITGSIPLGGAAVTRSVAVVNPTTYFAQSVKDALEAAGIPVNGEAVDYDDVAPEFAGAVEPRRVLATAESPTLRDMGTVLMKVSQNMYAETFLKAIGASEGGIGTAAAGRAAVRRLLTSWGIPQDAYILSDGSGLSRYNYVSAGMITAILERMYRDPRHQRPFALTLPIAGRDGTISSRMQGSLAEGNAVAKTGSIANVRSLSGYVRTRDGERLVFSILANDFPIPAGTVTWIADLAVEILAAFSRGVRS